MATAAKSADKADDSSKKHAGMGAIPHENGVAFRVWAPNADSIHVAGSFNDWATDTFPMQAEGNGNWYLDLAEAHIGDEYKYFIQNSEQELWRIDPRAGKLRIPWERA